MQYRQAPSEKVHKVRFYGLKRAFRGLVECFKGLIPRQDCTGRYIAVNGKWLKIDDLGKVHDIWIKKHQINGDKDRAEFLKREINKNGYRKTNDRIVVNELKQKGYL